MNSNYGCFLNNYQLGARDLGFCLITGFTCAPYAKRHWELSTENSKSSCKHKIIAVLQYTPVIGIVVGIIERIVVFAASFFPYQSRSPKLLNARGNTTVEEFIKCIEERRFKLLTSLTKEETEEFLERDGTLNIITPEKMSVRQITIRKGEQVITGCNSGINRSQVAAATVSKMGISVIGVLAGGDSAMNPEADFPSLPDPSEIGEEQFRAATNFEKVFLYPKLNQIGTEELGRDQSLDITGAKRFYQNFINRLSHPTHFITFGPCGLSVIRRLLQRKESLRDFTITHCPWGDEIAHPHPTSGLEKCSIESYELFEKNLSDCFRVL